MGGAARRRQACRDWGWELGMTRAIWFLGVNKHAWGEEEEEEQRPRAAAAGFLFRVGKQGWGRSQPSDRDPCCKLAPDPTVAGYSWIKFGKTTVN